MLRVNRRSEEALETNAYLNGYKPFEMHYEPQALTFNLWRKHHRLAAQNPVETRKIMDLPRTPCDFKTHGNIISIARRLWAFVKIFKFAQIELVIKDRLECRTLWWVCWKFHLRVVFFNKCVWFFVRNILICWDLTVSSSANLINDWFSAIVVLSRPRSSHSF